MKGKSCCKFDDSCPGWSFDIPDGLDWEIEDVSVCGPPFMPGAIGDLISKAANICPCIEPVGEFIANFGSDLSGMPGAAVEAAADLGACVVQNGVGEYKSTYSAAVQGETKGDFLILGPPIDLSMVFELLVAVATGGASLGPLMENYVSNLVDKLKDGLVDFATQALLGPLMPAYEAIGGFVREADAFPTTVVKATERCRSGVDLSTLQGVAEEEVNGILKTLEADVARLVEDINMIARKRDELEDVKNAIDAAVDSARNLQRPGGAILDPNKMVSMIEAITDGPGNIKSAIEALRNFDIDTTLRTVRGETLSIPNSTQPNQSEGACVPCHSF